MQPESYLRCAADFALPFLLPDSGINQDTKKPGRNFRVFYGAEQLSWTRELYQQNL